MVGEIFAVVQRQTPRQDQEIHVVSEHIVGVPVPQILDGTVTPSERVQWQTVEFFVDFPVPQHLKEIVTVVRRAPHEHVQQQTDECIVASPVPSISKEIVEVRKLFSQQRVQQGLEEHFADGYGIVNVPFLPVDAWTNECFKKAELFCEWAPQADEEHAVVVQVFQEWCLQYFSLESRGEGCDGRHAQESQVIRAERVFSSLKVSGSACVSLSAEEHW